MNSAKRLGNHLEPLEEKLRKKLDVPKPRQAVSDLFRQLLSFWQSFALYKKTCPASGKTIISVFDEQCPYPVWDREHWLKNATPPSADFDFDRPLYNQLWELFQQCPIPHNVGAGNENCDYADDWWYSRNCYLCHSGVKNEDCQYCYRSINLRDCRTCIFSFDSELCFETVNCYRCYNIAHSIECRNCRDSAFLFDCRDCEHCLFCWNLRGKTYHIENRPVSKNEYEKYQKELELASRKNFLKAQKKFEKLVFSKAFFKATDVEKCQDCLGNYLSECKNCLNCYFLSEAEDCVNFTRGYDIKDNIDCVGTFSSEIIYLCSLAQDNCYDIRYSYNVMKSKFLSHCAFCYQCDNCFGCCGLVGRSYCILNRQHSKEEYETLLPRLKEKIKKENLEGVFFPNHFAANTYEDSLAAFYFPLTLEEQKSLGHRTQGTQKQKPATAKPRSEVPDRAEQAQEDILKQTFWDETAGRPFQITTHDLKFAQSQNLPLPSGYYAQRLKALFSWLPYKGELRQTHCPDTKEKILSAQSPQLDPRTLSQAAYQKRLY